MFVIYVFVSKYRYFDLPSSFGVHQYYYESALGRAAAHLPLSYDRVYTFCPSSMFLFYPIYIKLCLCSQCFRQKSNNGSNNKKGGKPYVCYASRVLQHFFVFSVSVSNQICTKLPITLGCCHTLKNFLRRYFEYVNCFCTRNIYESNELINLRQSRTKLTQ